MNRFMWWHLYRHGHSIRVNRHISRHSFDSSKGWLYVCECEEVWAK